MSTAPSHALLPVHACACARARARACALCLAVALVAALAVAPAAGAAVGARLTIGRAPAVPAGARADGWLPAADALHLTVALAPRDPAALGAYARAVSTPGSPVYHRYLTVAQFAARFAPTAGQVAAVRAALRTEGVRAGALSPNGLALPVAAAAGRLGRAFATAFRRYRLADGRVAFANTAAPAVPATVAGLVQGVVGLDSLEVHRPAGLFRRPGALSGRSASGHGAGAPGAGAAGPGAAAGAASVQAPGEGRACTRAQSSGGYTAGQIAAAYGFGGLYGAGDGGAGQTIALFELEPYSTADLNAYERCYGSATPVTNVSVDGGSGSGGGQGEAALDVENLVGLVPQATVLVYQGPNTGQGAFDTYAAIINQDRARIVSTSWGSCENPVYLAAVLAENTLFQEAAAQGQTVLAASGDSGARDCGAGSSAAAVDDPASQPYVTGVGGTSLTTGGPSPVESAWNSSWGSGSSGASGGGVSTLWGVPGYQSPFAVAQSGTTCGGSGYACRQVPDVSADADINTGYAITYQGGWFVFGGTSAAAPTWAALMALGDATSACRAHPIGFVNGALYAAARSSYGTYFNDVTTGNNSFGGVGGFSAGPGYDMVTGLGSPRGSALIGAICGFASPAGSSSALRIGLPASRTLTAGTPARLAVSAVDAAGDSVSFAATGLPAGLSITAGGLITGTPRRAGRTTATITATDGAGTTTTAALTITVTGRTLVSDRIGALGDRVQLLVTAVAGSYSGGIRGIVIAAAPAELRFAGGRSVLARWVHATGAGHRRLRLSVTRRGDTLVAVLRGRASRTVTLRVLSPVLRTGAPGRASTAMVHDRARGLTITAWTA